MKLNGQPISLPFEPATDPNCNDYGISSGNVNLPAGTHELRAEGGTATATATYVYTSTAGNPPTAAFNYSPNPGLTGSAVTLDGSGSGAANGGPVTHGWEWQDEALDWSRGAAGATVQATWSQPGTYGVHLWVVDQNGLRDDLWSTVNVVAAPLPLMLTPADSVVVRAAFSWHTELFTVHNPRAHPVALSMQGYCVGTQVSQCSASRESVTLAPDASTRVGVTYLLDQVGGIPPGSEPRVRLKAWAAGWQDSAAYIIGSSTAASPAPMVGEVGEMTRLDRGACVIAAVGSAAYECGDLRLAHALPSTRVLNREYTPTLVYSSQHAEPHPIVAVPFSATPSGHTFGGPTVTQIRAVLMNGQTVLADRTWSGLSISTARWTSDEPMPVYRLAVGFDTELETGVYPYEVQITATHSNGTVEQRSPVPGRLVVVNRRASPFGVGWWVAGVESLHFPAADSASRLWVGGDGSYRLYERVSPTHWTTAAWDRPDTLRYDPVTLRYVRTLPGKVEVRFDAMGRHVETVDPAGRWTTFEWSGSQLSKIHLPRSHVFTSGYSYDFQYNNPGDRLSGVSSPGIVRSLSIGMSSGRITSITGPDSLGVSFGYPTLSALPGSRTDRRGVVTQFEFDPSRRLRIIRNTMGTPNLPSDDVTFTFRAAESLGDNWPQPVENVSTYIDGPLPHHEAVDINFFWLNRWGAPVRTADAYNIFSQVLVRGDPQWPGLVTSIVAANGFRTLAGYDERGRMVSQTALNPYDDGRNATTAYNWDPEWDAVTEVVGPEGEISFIRYDAAGRREWQQTGTSADTRVHFEYHPATHASAPGQIERVVLPDAHVERFEYDALGNLSAIETPLGIRTLFQNDLAGRLAAMLTPIDSAQTVFRKDTTIYDAAGRVRRTESWGPVNLSGQVQPGPERLVVEHDFDSEGNVRSTSRWSDPDPGLIGVVTTRWEYDPLGRVVVEIAPDSTASNPLDNPRDSTVYNLASLPVEVHGRNGHVTRMEYDDLGRLRTRITDQAVYPEVTVGSWSFPFYSSGMTIPADTVKLTYDESGNLLTADNRDARIRRTYYPNGALQTDTIRIRGWNDHVWDRHVHGLRSEYDRSGRRTVLHMPAELAPPYSLPYTVYDYNALGQLSAVGGFQFHYNAHGQLDRMVRPNGIELRHFYDADGRLNRRVEHAPNYPGTNRLGMATDTIHDDVLHYDVRGRVIYADLLTDSVRMAYSALGALTYSRTQPRPWDQPGTFDRWRTEVFTTDAMANLISSTTTDLQDGVWPVEYLYQQGTGRLRRTLYNGWPHDSEYDAAGNQIATSAQRVLENRSGTPTVTYEHTRQYYSAGHQLHFVDRRSSASLVEFPSASLGVFEEYRYDALGRRIGMRARRDSIGAGDGTIRRFVWDGDQLLFETRYPGDDGTSSHWLNADTATYYFERSCEEMKNCGAGPGEIPFPYGYSTWFGRIQYLHAGGIDAPLALTRVGYGRDTVFFEPFRVFPHANWRGVYTTGTYASGWIPPRIFVQGPNNTEQMTEVEIEWPGRDRRAYLNMGSRQRQAHGWMGSLIDEHRDASGLLYRRNRYYNPDVGRFTQEDPIGLAGGLNLYGYAGGDPVNFADPFGLNPCAFPIDVQECAKQAALAMLEGGVAWLRGFGTATGMLGIGEAATGISGDNGEPLSVGQRTGRGALAAATFIPIGRFGRGVQILEREGNHILGTITTSSGTANFVTELVRRGDDLILRGTHIEGNLSLRESLRVAREFGRREGAKRVIVEGGRRTTGANPGHVPRPIIVNTGL